MNGFELHVWFSNICTLHAMENTVLEFETKVRSQFLCAAFSNLLAGWFAGFVCSFFISFTLCILSYFTSYSLPPPSFLHKCSQRKSFVFILHDLKPPRYQNALTRTRLRWMAFVSFNTKHRWTFFTLQTLIFTPLILDMWICSKQQQWLWSTSSTLHSMKLANNTRNIRIDSHEMRSLYI